MLRLSAASCLVLVLTACSRPVTPAPAAPTPGPFIGVDFATLRPEERSIMQQASDDFRAVVEGKKPVHAVFDAEAELPADGGTTFYKGRGYDLTIARSLSSFGEFLGVAYGPIISFDAAFATGNASQISDIRVYSLAALDKLLH